MGVGAGGFSTSLCGCITRLVFSGVWIGFIIRQLFILLYHAARKGL